MQKLKIIIPSIGRAELIQTLKNISLDSQKIKNGAIQILLVSDGTAAFELNAKAISESLVYISPALNVDHLLNPGKGVSAALNHGLSFINLEDLFMIFTDDDEWLPGRTEILVKAILQHPSADVLLSRALLSDENGTSIRPKIQLSSNENILQYLYAKQPFRHNPVYFSLATMIAKGKVAKTRFREELTSHEDVVWLSDLQKQKFYVDGLTDVTANLNVSLRRSASRMNNGADQLFLRWFEKEDFYTYSNYLWVHAQRANSSEGNFSLVLKSVIENFRTSKPKIRQLLASLCLTSYAFLKRIS